MIVVVEDAVGLEVTEEDGNAAGCERDGFEVAWFVDVDKAGAGLAPSFVETSVGAERSRVTSSAFVPETGSPALLQSTWDIGLEMSALRC